MASGTALEREAIAAGLSPSLGGPVITELARSGDPVACEVVTLIGRRLAISVAAPVEVECEHIAQGKLKEFIADRLGDAAANVDFRLVRELSPRPAWTRWLERRDTSNLPRVELYGADVTALGFLEQSRFGRPSTQIHFVSALLERGYVDECGNVSPLGQQALNFAREHAAFLLDPSRIAAVDDMLDRNRRTSVPDLVLDLCDLIGLPIRSAQSVVSNWYLRRRHRIPQLPAATFDPSSSLVTS